MSIEITQVVSCAGCGVGLRIPVRDSPLRVRCPRCGFCFESGTGEAVDDAAPTPAVRPVRRRWPRPARGLLMSALVAVCLAGAAGLVLSVPPAERGPGARSALVVGSPAGLPAGRVDPCTAALTWRLGYLDAGFGVSRAAMHEAVERAIDAWEGATGRRLFAHDAAGRLSIHLVPGARVHRKGVYQGYRSDEALVGGAIEIYRFENRRDLAWVIAHELGHALGLDHVANPRALMYPVGHGRDPGEPLRAHAADLRALDARCR